MENKKSIENTENTEDIENVKNIKCLKDKQNTERIEFRVSEKQKKEIDECVNRLGITRASFIKFAVSKFLEENKVKRNKEKK